MAADLIAGRFEAAGCIASGLAAGQQLERWYAPRWWPEPEAARQEDGHRQERAPVSSPPMMRPHLWKKGRPCFLSPFMYLSYHCVNINHEHKPSRIAHKKS